jgi:hypothetical protein
MDTFQPILESQELHQLPSATLSSSKPMTEVTATNKTTKLKIASVTTTQHREKKFVMYYPKASHPMVSASNFHQEIYALPSIRFEGKNMIKNAIQLPLVTKFTIDFPRSHHNVSSIEERSASMRRVGVLPSDCSSYYNGTLHVIGKHHTHNLFHFGKCFSFPSHIEGFELKQ